MQSVVFITPFTNTENGYIARQVALVAGLGYEVRPLSVRALVSGRCWGLWSPENTVIVHWLENRVFRTGERDRRVSPVGLAEFVFYVAVLVAARARVVHVVHDHDVHDVRPSWRWLSRLAMRVVRRIADARVVHDPSFADHYDATYLPHPLYDEPAGSPLPHGRAVPRFAAMGAIRPYKQLAQALEVWPHGAPLLIAGHGDPDYLALLRAIVAERGLGDDVTIDDRFLPDDEFFAALADQDVLLLPHRDGANLVSGAFFAGVGRVRMVLARRTPFISWVAATLDGVASFEDDAGLPAAVRQIVTQWGDLDAADLTPGAIAQFGDEACRAAYGDFLKRTQRAPVGAVEDGRG